MTQERDGGFSLRLNGMRFELLADRAVHWPDENALLVADLHWGKEATFRFNGLAVPDVYSKDLQRLTALLQSRKCRRLFILGDLLHHRRGRSSELENTVAAWRNELRSVEMVLVRGNHDRHAGDPPTAWQFDTVDEPWKQGEVHLRHYPVFNNSTVTICGHWHPKHRLSVGREQISLPAFVVREQTLVLPAFSSFVDHGRFARHAADQVFVVAEDEVIPV